MANARTKNKTFVVCVFIVENCGGLFYLMLIFLSSISCRISFFDLLDFDYHGFSIIDKEVKRFTPREILRIREFCLEIYFKGAVMTLHSRKMSRRRTAVKAEWEVWAIHRSSFLNRFHMSSLQRRKKND